MKKEKIQVKNPARFWTGIGLVALEVVPAIIWGLTKLEYNWVTFKVLVASALVLYNVMAGIFIWNGSKK